MKILSGIHTSVSRLGFIGIAGVLAAVGLGLSGCSAPSHTEAIGGPGGGMDWARQAEIARGGRLYDKWYKEANLRTPQTPHAAYPADKKYAKKAGANWRCKECHGWDNLGKDGAYKSGKHHSGIVGVRGMAGASPAKVKAVLTDDLHGYAGLLSDADLDALALFVSQGQVDMARIIDPVSKAVKGDVKRGAAYFGTICAHCHGATGLEPKKMPPLGKLTQKNPWEVLHKVLNGQPAEEMPPLRVFELQVAADTLAFMQTLPTEK